MAETDQATADQDQDEAPADQQELLKMTRAQLAELILAERSRSAALEESAATGPGRSGAITINAKGELQTEA